MYKNQFEAWGFAKNLTKNRVRKILDPISIKNKIASSFDAVRIDRYLKRKKIRQVVTIPESLADHHSTHELSDNSALHGIQSPTSSRGSLACNFVMSDGVKFFIALDGGSRSVVFH